MIDGFPLVDGASDSQIQVLIGSDLETATRVKEEFARANPGFEERFRELLKQRVSIVAMGLRRPGQEQLYPELMKTTYRREWLFPLVRRFLWNYAQGEGGARWCGEISAMISPVMMGVRDVTDAEFLELAAAAAPLKSYSCLLYCSKLGSFFAAREKREPLTPPLLAAARALLPLCGDHSEELKKFAWPQFRDEAGLADADWGWSVRLHRELSGLKKKDRTLWLKVLDGTPIRANSRRAAAAKVGNTEIERFLRRSIELLREDAEVELSPFGAVLFWDLIGLCELMGGNACDEILYEIARTNWKRIRAPYWPAEYLRTMERRPPDRAFACLEAMLMNPVTGDQFVRRRYDALATTFAAREQVSAPIGADGYVLESDWELRQQQARIDQLLQMGASAADQGGWDPPNSVKHPDYFRLTPAAHEAIEAMTKSVLREFAGDLPRLHTAVMKRTEWIRAHHEEFSRDRVRVWWQILTGLGCEGGLAQRSLAGVKEVTLEELLATLRSRGGEQVPELCQKYVDRNGWCRELVEGLHKYIATIGSALSDQVRRARAEWFLWFEDVCPIDLNACWSHRVKRDLRGMTAEERAAWKELMDNHSFRWAGKPAPAWFKAAEERFGKMDREVFRRRFVEWFEPFSKPEPLRLTVTGRNVLRVLMWYALIAEDSRVDEALAGFAKAKWKTKDAAAKASQAEMAFSYVMSQRDPEVALPILEEYVSSGRAFDGSETHRIYVELCGKKGRIPMQALPDKSKGQGSASGSVPSLVGSGLPAAD